MKAIYWKDLKVEDRRLWLMKHSESFPVFLILIWIFAGFLFLGMIFSLAGTTAIDTGAVAKQALSSNITAYTDWIETKELFAEGIIEIFEFTPYIAIIFIVLLFIEVVLDCFNRYSKFYRMHFKYAEREIDFSRWVKDKIDGKII